MFDQLVKRSDAVWIYRTGRFAEERRAFLFATSPARWAPILTLTSFNSGAIARARFISPSMTMPTVAANKPHSS